MVKLWSVGGRLVRKDGYTYQYVSFVGAPDEIQAEVLVRQAVLANVDVKKINDILLQEIPLEDVMFFNDIIDYTFSQKLDWAETDVMKGITEGKPLRESLCMVLMAVSEDAYNRGRLAAQHAT
jgi:hypothetical protein